MNLTSLSMGVFLATLIGPSQPQQSAMHTPHFHKQTITPQPHLVVLK